MTYHSGVCPECSKNGDISEKELLQCKYCETSFCYKHTDAKDVYFPIHTTINEVPGDTIQKSFHHMGVGRNDGHPCFEYMRKHELEINVRSRNAIKQGYKQHYHQVMIGNIVLSIVLVIIGAIIFFVSSLMFNVHFAITLFGVLFLLIGFINIPRALHNWKVKEEECR
jgi:hypothetical protein